MPAYTGIREGAFEGPNGFALCGLSGTQSDDAVDQEMRIAGGYALTVTDDGIGIAVENLSKVLKPFTQIESSMSRKHQGAGLGLPLVKRLVECHGGTLEIESEPDNGTTVTVRLPQERLQRHDDASAAS